MGMASPKKIRSLSTIALYIGVLAMFLLIASVLLISHPLNSSFHGYFLGVDRYIVSLDRNQIKTKDISSNKTEVVELGSPLFSHSENNLTGNSESFDDEPSSSNKSAISPSDSTPSNDSQKVVSNFYGNSKSAISPSDSAPSNDSQKVVSNFYGNSKSAISHSDSAPSNDSQKVVSKKCDLYHGKWVYDPAGPLYTNNTCPIITQMQNCQGNGRPDNGYENWRWKPEGCDLPRFDPKKFLEMMRGKTLAFIGDSVARNQMESMLCILWQVETPKNRGNRRMQRWYFRSTSTSIVRIWSSWLVRKTSQSIDFAPEGLDKVHLDVPDETFMEFLPNFDVLVLSSGHWFAKRSAYVLNGKIIGGQLWWPKEAGKMRVNNVEAFGMSVETALTAVASNPNFTGIAITRSYSPDHYEGGAWNTGGSCTGKTQPASEVVRNGFTDVMHEKQVTGFDKSVNNTGGKMLRLMDITEAFGYRADGHPGPYRSPDPRKVTKRGPNGEPPPQDCLHWCMPGPIDTWNEIVMEIIRREYERA